MDQTTRPGASPAPCGINHIVLNVSDMDVAHLFWTESLWVPARRDRARAQ